MRRLERKMQESDQDICKKCKSSVKSLVKNHQISSGQQLTRVGENDDNNEAE